MKTTIRQIKRLIREALREATGTMWGTKEELDHSISAMDPETIVDLDYVDVDTGEVYLEKGQSAGESRLHPEYARQAEVERVARDQSWADEEAQWAKEDAEEASYQANKINDASNEFSDASRKFAESAKSYR